MVYLLEWVTEATVLMRHPNVTATIRAFFKDAGKNSVRAFYDDESGLGGYVFHDVNPKTSSDDDDSGRWYRLVTTCDVTLQISEPSGEQNMLRPTAREKQRIERQVTHHEWFSGHFRGRLDRVANVNVMGTPEEVTQE
jgi:hypothetical protein